MFSSFLPPQLKEKRRIEEAGGRVSMNGVWRVAGILATSRALGDFPLKEKRLITCEPDVLSFDLNKTAGNNNPGNNPGESNFVVLATDGLWDTHSNEAAAEAVRKSLKASPGDLAAAAKDLATEAYDKESLDNVTVLIMAL